MKNRIIFLVLFTTLYFYHISHGQDSTSIKSNRLKTVIYTSTGTYALGLIGLNTLWYKNSSQTNFHFFNDNRQWLQVDKVGHSYSAYQLSRFSHEAFRWAGLPDKKAAFWGGMLGIIYQTPIEILDGFSEEYGASWGDLLANTLGSTLFWGQEAAWKEQRITFKYSFVRSPYATTRPKTLGSNFLEESIKDYNAQTYWLSGNIASFIPEANFPKWLNLAFGYGGEEMIYANPYQNSTIGLTPYRQYYLALDLDLTRIKTKSKALKTVFFILNSIKVPLPTIEFDKESTNFHFFKF